MTNTLYDLAQALQWLAPSENLDNLYGKSDSTPISAMYALSDNMPGIRAACLNTLHETGAPKALDDFILRWVKDHVGQDQAEDGTAYISHAGLQLPGYGVNLAPENPEELAPYFDLLTFFLRYGSTPLATTPNQTPPNPPTLMVQPPIPEIDWNAYQDPSIRRTNRPVELEESDQAPSLYDVENEIDYEKFMEAVYSFRPTAAILYHSIINENHVGDSQWYDIAALIGWLFSITDNICVDKCWEELGDAGEYYVTCSPR